LIPFELASHECRHEPREVSIPDEPQERLGFVYEPKLLRFFERPPVR
jgi:hypothetical protein